MKERIVNFTIIPIDEIYIYIKGNSEFHKAFGEIYRTTRTSLLEDMKIIDSYTTRVLEKTAIFTMSV